MFLPQVLLSIVAVFKRETHILRVGHWFLVLEETGQIQGTTQPQKTYEKTLRFHLGLILGSVQACLSAEGQPQH